jgi:tetratricopeptide (TPR) repeat protein
VRWLVGASLAGASVLALWLAFRASAPADVEPAAVRSERLRREGEHALARGELSSASEHLDQAFALARDDVRVLVSRARLNAARVDEEWLRMLLLPEEPDQARLAARQSLVDWAERAQRSVEEALARTPDDRVVQRARIDVARAAGDVDLARGLAQSFAATRTREADEDAYTLAALEVAEQVVLQPSVFASPNGAPLEEARATAATTAAPANPAPTAVGGDAATTIDRLRVAVRQEDVPGRARALLVFALARSGDVEAARGELVRLALLARAHPLLGDLRAFVDRATRERTGRAEPTDADRKGRVGDAGKPPERSRMAADAKASAPPKEPSRRGRDEPRVEKPKAVDVAAATRAETETALADRARLEGALTSAKRHYERAVAADPKHLPALVGLADVAWESGQRPQAIDRYRRIVAQFPEGYYPPRVKERSEAVTP